MDERQTIHRVQQGDAEAFRAIVLRYQGALFAIARSYLRDEGRGEDLVQDAFLKAFAALGRFDPDRGRLAPWLYAIARNACKDALRRRGESSAIPEGLVAKPVSTGTAALHAHLDRALAALPADRRTAFLLVVVHGLSIDEAALIEGVAAGTIKSRISRARSALRVELETES